jgi:hypothetical protein
MYSFAENEIDDVAIAVFTKRLDTLLASTTEFDEEAERLPSALKFLSTDPHLTEEFRAKLVEVLEHMNKASVAGLKPELERAKAQLRDINERATQSNLTTSAQRVINFDRKRYEEYIADLEKKRKQKAKFPTRSTLEDFTEALEATGLVPEIYVLALKNGFNTRATLRKILQSLLALWGFERVL